jgi:hypothetical protein
MMFHSGSGLRTWRPNQLVDLIGGQCHRIACGAARAEIDAFGIVSTNEKLCCEIEAPGFFLLRCSVNGHLVWPEENLVSDQAGG